MHTHLSARSLSIVCEAFKMHKCLPTDVSRWRTTWPKKLAIVSPVGREAQTLQQDVEDSLADSLQHICGLGTLHSKNYLGGITVSDKVYVQGII